MSSTVLSSKQATKQSLWDASAHAHTCKQIYLQRVEVACIRHDLQAQALQQEWAPHAVSRQLCPCGHLKKGNAVALMVAIVSGVWLLYPTYTLSTLHGPNILLRLAVGLN